MSSYRKNFLSLTILASVLLTATVSANSEDLQREEQLTSQNSTQPIHERSQTNSAPTSGKRQSTRGGRMLDLDHLAGDIKKEEKVARERSLSGQRQSRMLGDDFVQVGQQAGESERSNVQAYGRKQKSKGKKMAIKGFIPIISLEGSKEGKHFENPMDLLNNEHEDDEAEQDSEQVGSENGSLLTNYGGQTSIGHASFASQQPDQRHQQQQSQQQGDQWQQFPSANNDQDQSEVARANRKLLGSAGILSGLTSPGKRFVSNLLPNQHQFSAPQLGLPMASQLMPTIQHQTLMADSSVGCMCVPFFQCKNGYLSESQLSRGQLAQLGSTFAGNQFQNHHHQQQQAQFALGHQIPRALNFNNHQQSQATNGEPAMYNNANAQQQQQQLISQNFMAQLNPDQKQQLISHIGGQPANEQQLNDMIYEQLRKNIEGGNLDQQLLLQMQQQQQSGAFPSLDERSKTGSQQAEANKTSGGEEVFERSLFNPLTKRQSGQPKCGIMRTCCKIPQHLMAYQQHPGRGLGLPQQPARLASPMNRPQTQSQYQILQPDSQLNHPLNSNSMNQDYNQVAATSAALGIQPVQQRPPMSRPQSGGGSFMAGRCGTRQTLGIAGRVQNAQPSPGGETTADFGEFPSHVAILKRLSPGDSMFVCSASLISNQWVATAAHCIKKHRIEELKVRLGEWDVNRDDEFYPHMESNIREIVIHPDFQPASLINDVALLRLDTPVIAEQMPHISPACLPAPNEVFDQQRCWVTGWGKDAFGQQGTFQSVLKKVDLPVIGHQDCENALRYQTKLGKFFRLHQSAICAGGERGKDACEGDGGAGLYCADPESGSIKVAGLVSWGVGCGQRGVPGVYTNLAYLSSWIEQVVVASGEDSLYSFNNEQFKNVISERSNQPSNNGTTIIDSSNNSTATELRKVL